MTRARLISLLLALTLGFATVGVGVARGQAPVAGQMVLCTGLGAITTSVDADGNPVERHGLCPDAALVFLAAVGEAPQAALQAELSLAWLDRPAVTQAPTPHRPLTRGARAPPA